ncbi:MAG: histidine phosphatase family protein [Candidatus Taylorbacteria bacterium]|nr:histidine phosphatase family protein [Candidatus Taylorbacteria bacterium]
MEHLETPASPEANEKARVLLHFFRHGEQFKDPTKSDPEYELSPTGREQGMKKAKAVNGKTNLRQTMAFGSPRKRAQQTASFAMAGEALDTIVGDESLSELKAKLNKDIPYGSKVMGDPRLDFFMDKNTPFGKEAFDAFAAKKQYLKFLAEDSDRLAGELRDKNGSTYSRQARGVAEILKKYLTVANQWDKLVKDGKYTDSKLERFLGSHGGVTESFLLKVIEKTKGVAERDKLIALMPNGFDYTEGFDITITNQGESKEPVLHISYKKVNEKDPKLNFEFDEDVPLAVIQDIAGQDE